MQRESFSVGWGSPTKPTTETNRPFKNNDEAKAARDARYKELKAQGIKARRSILKGQLRQYWGWQAPCGITSNCYELEF
jgi:hypothetical protein